ncbi:MAG: hypothetical protein J6N72_07915 [Psychrobacter sp.]|nr:hypothetical protein [Psychrobacter sp.]
MTKIETTEQAHDADLAKKVRVYYQKPNAPATRLESVEYIELTGDSSIINQVKKLENGFVGKTLLEPGVDKNGTHKPTVINRTDKTIGITIIDNKDALLLLGRKVMNDKAASLTRSLLWGAGRKSFG